MSDPAIGGMHDAYEVIVVGAGPAGLAAASLTARAGLATLLVDEQASPGGQIHRGITASPFAPGTVLGDDYWAGEKLTRAFSESGAEYLPGATVWMVSADHEVGVSVAGRARILQATHVVLATGAIERPFPIPGWTLPGVMTAGAAQTLLKTSRLLPSGRVVLAGSGPLLWLLASQVLEAGGSIDALLETVPPSNRWRAARHALGFAFSPYRRKGLVLLRNVRSRVKLVADVTSLAAEGSDRVTAVRYTAGDGSAGTLPADLLLLHQGVVPNVNLAMSAGVLHAWDERQLCFAPVVSRYGATAVPGIYVAGDGAGIAGAQAAAWRGTLAAADIIHHVRKDLSVPAAKLAQTALNGYLRGRAFLDVLYAPPRQFRMPADDTIACRCEEVTAGEIRGAVALGCTGPNQLKAFTRCGMGPCQGRLCGLTVTEIIAQARGTSPANVGYYNVRPPVKPITVAELASLPKTPEALRAVVRDN